MTCKGKCPFFGQKIQIKNNAPLFPGEKAVIAYIGADGVSVFLEDGDKFDEAVPLEWNEYEEINQP